MTRRVCSITHLDLRRENGPTLHVRGIVDGLRRSGLEVDVIATGESRGDWVSLGPQPQGILSHLRFQLRVLRALAARRGAYDWLYVRAGSVMLTPLYALAARAPVALEINGIPHLESEFPGALRAVIRRLFTWQVRGARVCFAVTPELRDLAARLGQRRAHAIPNGVDRRTLCAAATRAARPERPPRRLVFVGALQPWQGVHLAVEAVHDLRRAGLDVRLDVYGDGVERAALAAQIERLGLAAHVHLHGHVDRDTIYAALRGADVAVAPFIPDARNQAVGGLSPLKVYEYLAFDLPVVTTPLMSDAELLAALPDEVRIVEADASALAWALRRVLGEAREAGRAGAWIARHRTWDAAAERTAALMNDERSL